MADQNALTAQLIKSLIAQQQQAQQIQPPSSTSAPFGALAMASPNVAQPPAAAQPTPDQPGIISGLWDGLSNGAKAQLAQAKWVASGMNGPQPPQYTGGPNYP